VTHQGAYRALESWDGNWLYVGRGQPLGGIVVLPVHGTEQEWRAAESAPILPEVGPEASTDWDVCREGLVYRASADNSSPRVDVFNLQTRKSRPLLALRELPAGTDLSISVLPDGQSIVYTIASTHSELSIMTRR